MKIKVYGYYNYGNVYDQKEHITVTPINDIEGRADRDYSGNIYEFELNGKISPHIQLEYQRYTEKLYDENIECDCLIDKSNKIQIQVNPDKYGYTHWGVTSKNGCCYLLPDIWGGVPEKQWINLGNLKAHKI